MQLKIKSIIELTNGDKYYSSEELGRNSMVEDGNYFLEAKYYSFNGEPSNLNYSNFRYGNNTVATSKVEFLVNGIDTLFVNLRNVRCIKGTNILVDDGEIKTFHGQSDIDVLNQEDTKIPFLKDEANVD